MENHASQSQAHPERCNWCDGQGVRGYAFAYVPGPRPFDFAEAQTAVRAGTCRNCRGRGVYDAALDPTLGHLRRGR